MLHHDGMIRVSAGERTYVVAPLKGVAARRVYAALWRAISDKRIVALGQSRTSDARAGAAFAAALCTTDEWAAIVDEVLTGAKVVRPGLPDLTLPADADEAWRCRPAEANTIAWEALDDQGFFVVPGTSSSSAQPQGTTPTPSAPSPSLNDAV